MLVLIIVHTGFHSSLFLSLFLLLSLLSTHFKDTQEAEILFALIFGITRRIIKNNNKIYLYFSSRRACVRQPWWRTKRSWPLFSPTQEDEILFALIFGIIRRNLKNIYHFYLSKFSEACLLTSSFTVSAMFVHIKYLGM